MKHNVNRELVHSKPSPSQIHFTNETQYKHETSWPTNLHCLKQVLKMKHDIKHSHLPEEINVVPNYIIRGYDQVVLWNLLLYSTRNTFLEKPMYNSPIRLFFFLSTFTNNIFTMIKI